MLSDLDEMASRAYMTEHTELPEINDPNDPMPQNPNIPYPHGAVTKTDHCQECIDRSTRMQTYEENLKGWKYRNKLRREAKYRYDWALAMLEMGGSYKYP